MIAALYLSSGSPLLLITLHHPLRILLGLPLLDKGYRNLHEIVVSLLEVQQRS